MLIEQIIRRMRASETMFGDRIAGLATLRKLREHTNLAVPAAFVLPDGEAVSNVSAAQGGVVRSFDVAIRFVVAVILDAYDDARRQDTTHQLEDVRADLFRAILNWRPSTGYDYPVYTSMTVGGEESGQFHYLYRFQIVEHMTRNCSGLETGLDALKEMAEGMEANFVAPPIVGVAANGEPVRRHKKGVHVALRAVGCTHPPGCGCAAEKGTIVETTLKENC